MIHIKRPAAAPTVLTSRGAAATAVLCAEYDSDPDAYSAGRKTFTFNSDIYAHDSVKDALITAQHGKCAFCESKFAHQQYGDVEHYRPKAGVKQRERNPLGRPGYYWLAYEWGNLLLSCALCNQQFKKNLFPLQTQSRRARSHRDNIRDENPLLLDPAVDDPDRHLGFYAELYRPLRRSRRGTTTIETLGLNRDALAEFRRDRLAQWRVLLDVWNLLRQQVHGGNASPEILSCLAGVDSRIAEARQDGGEYAAMARANLL